MKPQVLTRRNGRRDTSFGTIDMCLGNVRHYDDLRVVLLPRLVSHIAVYHTMYRTQRRPTCRGRGKQEGVYLISSKQLAIADTLLVVAVAIRSSARYPSTTAPMVDVKQAVDALLAEKNGEPQQRPERNREEEKYTRTQTRRRLRNPLQSRSGVCIAQRTLASLCPRDSEQI